MIKQQLDKLQAALTTDEQQRLLRDVREAIFPEDKTETTEDKAETTAAPASPLSWLSEGCRARIVGPDMEGDLENVSFRQGSTGELVKFEDGYWLWRSPLTSNWFPATSLEPSDAPPLSYKIMLDLLCGAMEGGSNFWARLNLCDGKVASYKGDTLVDKVWRSVQHDEAIQVIDIEDNQVVGTIDKESLITGSITMAEKYPDHFKDAVEQTGDAITADVWFQCVVMNEITYG
jgi:hypothetical protein